MSGRSFQRSSFIMLLRALSQAAEALSPSVSTAWSVKDFGVDEAVANH